MKTLSELLKDVDIKVSKGPFDIEISNLSFSSKTIEKNGLFVALVGEVTDGHKYIGDAIQAGAKVIIYERDLEEFKDDVTYVSVANSHEALAMIAGNFYDHPSESIKIIGVTGTNGKTTIATLLYQLFLNLGHRVGLMSSIVDKINDKVVETSRATPTTPDAINLNKLLRMMVDEGCTYCFMEVSSHALSLGRFKNFVFAGGIFTNLTLDHLDHHKTMENYRDAKKIFFDMLPDNAFVLSNIDDANGEYMLRDTKAKKYSYGLKNDADFTERLETKLIGEFNTYNILAVYGAAVLLDEDRGLIQKEIKNLDSVTGRFQYFTSKQGVIGIVDYAHTPDALENVLKTVNGIKKDGKVIALFGCGGDRDKTKRPIMAKIGYDMSDIVILTSDNPRSENPESILEDMKAGLPADFDATKVYIISDRKEAIEKACSLANSGDYILLAGKGHETYQEINGTHSHFDDMEELKKYLK